jgi:hypothetical protein
MFVSVEPVDRRQSQCVNPRIEAMECGVGSDGWDILIVTGTVL